jgi:hypothetical protein
MTKFENSWGIDMREGLAGTSLFVVQKCLACQSVGYRAVTIIGSQELSAVNVLCVFC